MYFEYIILGLVVLLSYKVIFVEVVKLFFNVEDNLIIFQQEAITIDSCRSRMPGLIRLANFDLWKKHLVRKSYF